MHDLVIRNGSVADGNGGDVVDADVAVDGGLVTAVGSVSARGREEIDARGRLVTPGFVDIHTHFDGQITWDPFARPSIGHGVTTIVTGNCGVGFAPCRVDRRDWLIGLMEGVEDIPGAVLHEGIDWQWESFPEFLDAVSRFPLAIDVGTQIPHGAVRPHVMGERGALHEPASPEEIAQMGEIVAEAIQAGALGFSTSRTVKHADSSGVLTPSITASEDELVGIATALGRTGSGVIQGISDFVDFDAEFHLFRRMAEASGRPVSITVEQQDYRPNWWRQLLDGVSAAQRDGLAMRGQVPPRATGIVLGLELAMCPFSLRPSYKRMENEPLERKVAALRDPEFRARLIAEEPKEHDLEVVNTVMNDFHKMYELGDPPDYEPDPRDSVAARAERENRRPEDVVIEMLLANDGHGMIYFPVFNYITGDLEIVREMLEHPYTTLGLGDAGAHCRALCDASFPTTLLQHWGRDRTRGPKLPLGRLVAMTTRETAELVGLRDRGVLAPGYKADLNVIDFDQLAPKTPEFVADLPAGGKRLVQGAKGYEATIVSGTVVCRDGEPTGATPGRLVRGAQLPST